MNLLNKIGKEVSSIAKDVGNQAVKVANEVKKEIQNQFSFKGRGKIHIQLNHAFYYQGETISGKVLLDLQEEFPKGAIKMKLYGKEKVKWLVEEYIDERPPQQPQGPGGRQKVVPRKVVPEHLVRKVNEVLVSSDSSDSSDDEQQQRKKNRPEYIRKNNGLLYQIHRYEGEEVFMKEKFELKKFDSGKIPAGQYSFPFCFKVGQNWPASFARTGKHERARIKYFLESKLDFKEDRKCEVKSQIEPMIYERPDKIMSSNKSLEAEIMSCCCCSNGKSKIEVNFEKNGYSYGQEARFICEVDNSQCKANVTNVHASLNQTIDYTDGKGHRNMQTFTLQRKSFQGVPAGQTLKGPQALRETIKIDNPEASRDCRSKKCFMPTSTGRLIKSSFYIAVSSELDACCVCCSSIPIVHNSVVIFPQKEQAQQKFQPPPNWKPIQEPIKVIQAGGIAIPPGAIKQAEMDVEKPPEEEGVERPPDPDQFGQ